MLKIKFLITHLQYKLSYANHNAKLIKSFFRYGNVNTDAVRASRGNKQVLLV